MIEAETSRNDGFKKGAVSSTFTFYQRKKGDMTREVKNSKQAMRDEMAKVIRERADDINRPKLKTITSKDLEKIHVLPMNRVACVACGVPLYVNNIGTDKKKTVQVADSMSTGGGNGCRHFKGGVSKLFESH